MNVAIIFAHSSSPSSSPLSSLSSSPPICLPHPFGFSIVNPVIFSDKSSFSLSYSSVIFAVDFPSVRTSSSFFVGLHHPVDFPIVFTVFWSVVVLLWYIVVSFGSVVVISHTPQLLSSTFCLSSHLQCNLHDLKVVIAFQFFLYCRSEGSQTSVFDCLGES